MIPPVRGAQRAAVAVLFVGSATIAGGLVGFALGAIAAAVGVPAATPVVLVAATVAALAADTVATLTGRAPPLSVNRQVPQAWSRLFASETVAVLYGGRLGVGPLTILTTWMWWAAAVVGASLGPGSSAVVGGVFGLVRTLAVVAASQWVLPAGAIRMARLRAVEPFAHWGGAVVAVTGVGLALAL